MTYLPRIVAATLLVTASALSAAGCGSSSPSPAVPTAEGAATPAAGESGGRPSSAAVAAAVRCIRSHGISRYQDPVITPDGAVYTDTRSFGDTPESTVKEVERSCGALMARAKLDRKLPPAPPALVQAGVKAAECGRAHGLPAMRDPNASTPYTPGHGFGMSHDAVPGGKDSPGFQQMRRDCRAEIDAMMEASTLASLGGHGS
jgi:hypothetical protein